MELEEGLEQEVAEESLVNDDWEKVVHSIRKRVVMAAFGFYSIFVGPNIVYTSILARADGQGSS